MGAVLASPKYGENWLSLDGSTVNVEDYPLLWIDELYYNTYKGDTFVLPTNAGNEIWSGDAIDYAAVTEINLNNQSLTTNFTSTLLSKYKNLTNLYIYTNSVTNCDINSLNKSIKNIWISNNAISNDVDLTGFNELLYFNVGSNEINNLTVGTHLNMSFFSIVGNNINNDFDFTNCINLVNCYLSNNQISNVNINSLTSLRFFEAFNNNLTSIDLSTNTALKRVFVQGNDLTDLSLANNTLVNNVRCNLNQLTAATNSTLLEQLDGHGQINGYFQSTIFDANPLTTAGTTAKSNLLAKGWDVVGV